MLTLDCMLTWSIMLTNKLQQDALEKTKCFQGLGLEQEGYQPPSRSPLVIFSIGEGDSRHFGPMCLLFLN